MSGSAELVAVVAIVVGLGLSIWWVLLLRKRRRYTIREFPGFLDDDECAHLIECAAARLGKSKVIFQGKRGGEDLDRASATAFLEHAQDPVIQRIKRRIAEISDTRIDQQERIQVTHYTTNQRYAPHYDSLRAGHVDPGPPGDRYCTVIIYLNDDFQGGATYFPRVRQRIQAQKGKAVLFHNLSDDGEHWDRLAFHAGEKVLGGEKWLSNQWIRQHRRHQPTAEKRTRKRSGKRRRRSY